ncbi:MAG TPA: hypothetical protein VM759_01020 [Longimicrobium sp.]|nr:hypothetical protein [Longimicrobium sp.]
MFAKPSRLRRLIPRLRRERPVVDLDAYRRASVPVFELFERAEEHREACRTAGVDDPWSIPQAARTELVCAWNAFSLQVLGNCLVDAARAADSKRGLPRGTAEQALEFYQEVETWMARAHLARANPGAVGTMPLPARLPRWSEDADRSTTHLAGLRHAMRSLGGHVTEAMVTLPAAVPGDGAKEAGLARIREAHAAAQARARHAEELFGSGAAAPAHAFAEAYVRDAIERFHLLGQAVADPALAERTDLVTNRPVDLGAGTGGTVVRKARRRFRRRLGKREREMLSVASDPQQPFRRRQDAVMEACRGRTPVGELIALYDWLDDGALREMLVFGLLSRREEEAVEMIARIARRDPDPQVRHAALFWLRTSRHRQAPQLLASFGAAAALPPSLPGRG